MLQYDEALKRQQEKEARYIKAIEYKILLIENFQNTESHRHHSSVAVRERRGLMGLVVHT